MWGNLLADANTMLTLPWWVQILPGLNIVGLVMGLRRLARLELMVETLWTRSGIDRRGNTR
jgi:hypothetical protein